MRKSSRKTICNTYKVRPVGMIPSVALCRSLVCRGDPVAQGSECAGGRQHAEPESLTGPRSSRCRTPPWRNDDVWYTMLRHILFMSSHVSFPLSDRSASQSWREKCTGPWDSSEDHVRLHWEPLHGGPSCSPHGFRHPHVASLGTLTL